MRLSVITLLALSLNVFVTTAQEKQTSENPFDKLGYDPLVATSSRGEFAEFHDQADIVEIGSVLFNTKTNEVIKVLKDGETTIDLSSATAAMSIDPHCEKYYWISPYAYCANNPLKFIDPNGMDIYVYYYDNNNERQHFVFTGNNHADAPDNQFVSDFLIAYDYNIANGGGENLMKAATTGDITMNIQQAANWQDSYAGFNKETGEHTKVVWNTRRAETSADGHTMSPATILEHEAGHAMSSLTKPANHVVNSREDKSPHGSPEETRVITQVEARQAQLNGEYPSGYIRPDHQSTTVRVNTPITNGVIRPKPLLFLFQNAGKYKYYNR